MNPVEKDDFIHALGQTLKFYNKDLDREDGTFWVHACRDYPVERLKQALLAHVKQSKFAPKPADLINILSDGTLGMQKAQSKLPAPEKANPCPPDIAKAWMWFIGRCAEGSKNLDGLFDSKSGVSLDEQERYLHIVNHEAKLNNQPDAIPSEYRLAEVWGQRHTE